jgi:hypothetical protein
MIISATLRSWNRDIVTANKVRSETESHSCGTWSVFSSNRIPVGARYSAPVQTGPGAYPASYTMGTGSFPRVKWPGRDVDHTPLSNAEVRIELYVYSPSVPAWPVRVNFTFTHTPSTLNPISVWYVHLSSGRFSTGPSSNTVCVNFSSPLYVRCAGLSSLYFATLIMFVEELIRIIKDRA